MNRFFFNVFSLAVSIAFNSWQLTMDNWQWNGRWADSWFLKTFSLNTFSLGVPYCLQQLTMDSWQLTMKRQMSRLLFLNSFILNTFSLAVSIAYCLLRFQIALTPSALTPSAWQFLLPIASAVPYCLFRLPTARFFFLWGVAPNPTSFFVLTQKRRQKRSRLRPFRSKNRRS